MTVTRLERRTAGYRLPTKPAFSQLSEGRREKRYFGAGCGRDGRRGNGPNMETGNGRPNQPEFRVASRLKWPTALYRPAMPDGVRRQDARRRSERACWGVAKR